MLLPLVFLFRGRTAAGASTKTARSRGSSPRLFTPFFASFVEGGDCFSVGRGPNHRLDIPGPDASGHRRRCSPHTGMICMPQRFVRAIFTMRTPFLPRDPYLKGKNVTILLRLCCLCVFHQAVYNYPGKINHLLILPLSHKSK